MHKEKLGKDLTAIKPINKRVAHMSAFYDPHGYAYYEPLSKETFTYGASLSRNLGLQRVAFHHEFLAPGQQSSWAHAHSYEEEAVYILKGNPTLYVKGESKATKPGDFIFFKPGTGWTHCLKNETDEHCEMLVVGEMDTDDHDLIFYENEDRNDTCKIMNFFWEGVPDTPPLFTEIVCYPEEIEPDAIRGYSEEDNVEASVIDFSRAMGARRIAFKLIDLPAGKRTSYPHAEMIEEEFCYVLEGNPTLFFHDREIELTPLTAVAFPAGEGLVHSIENKTDKPVKILFSGELSKLGNKYFYPQNPELKQEDDHAKYWWENPPVPAEELFSWD